MSKYQNKNYAANWSMQNFSRSTVHTRVETQLLQSETPQYMHSAFQKKDYLHFFQSICNNQSHKKRMGSVNQFISISFHKSNSKMNREKPKTLPTENSALNANEARLKQNVHLFPTIYWLRQMGYKKISTLSKSRDFCCGLKKNTKQERH